jgi:succinate dehydrogenase / fumarate reductase flavoprotein subunit
MSAAAKRVIVVGGGLAGLACSIKLGEDGVNVDLFSMVPVKRSHSVCAQGGINACNDIARQQGYSEWIHFDETVLGGDFLADQPPVLEMCNWAPRIIDLLDRMGVPFNRTPEGQRDLRLFGGSLVKRTFFAGATTGQQILYALDEQTRRLEAEGLVKKYEFWEFLSLIIHDGCCVGIVAQDMRTMQIRAFRADAVVIATGGCGLIFGKSTMSVICTGGAASRCYQAGAKYGNPEFVQVHPTAIPGEDKCRVISESARGEGGRVWVPKRPGDTRQPNAIPESERFYFLEERYPKYGNLVPRDIATREIFQVCTEMKLGVGGGNIVYLDLADLVKKDGRERVLSRLEGILEIYEKFVGVDPLDEPMKIFPAVHYSMGGLWAGFKKDEKTGGLKSGDPANMMTSIPGLYAMGEVSRRKPARRQFAAELHLRRPVRRPMREKLLHRCRRQRGRCAPIGLRRRRQARNRSAKPACEQPGR